MRLGLSVMVAFVFSIVFCGNLFAQVWKCSDVRRSGFTYTDVPTSSAFIHCQPASSLALAPFNKLSRESFERLSFREEDVEIGKEVGKRDKSVDKKASSKEREIHLKWSYKEVRESNGNPFDRKCEINGEVRDRLGGPFRITVTRGALTIETFRIVAIANYQPTPLRLVLNGSCREPRVEIVG